MVRQQRGGKPPAEQISKQAVHQNQGRSDAASLKSDSTSLDLDPFFFGSSSLHGSPFKIFLGRTTPMAMLEFYLSRYRLCRLCKMGSFGSPLFQPKLRLNRLLISLLHLLTVYHIILPKNVTDAAEHFYNDCKRLRLWYLPRPTIRSAWQRTCNNRSSRVRPALRMPWQMS